MSIVKFETFLCFAFILNFTTIASANKNESQLAITSYYSSFSDLALSEGDIQQLAPSIEVEFSFRLHSVFNFTISSIQFLNDTESAVEAVAAERSGFGIGAKIDLPGVFFIGSRPNIKRKGKNYPINSFIFANILRTTTISTLGEESKSMTTKYGLGADIFLFNNVAYLSLIAGLYLNEGNSFSTTGAGLGLTF